VGGDGVGGHGRRLGVSEVWGGVGGGSKSDSSCQRAKCPHQPWGSPGSITGIDIGGGKEGAGKLLPGGLQLKIEGEGRNVKGTSTQRVKAAAP